MAKMGYEHQRAPTFIRNWRKHKKVSQEKLAEALDLSHTTVGRIEKGELPYNQDFLERVALYLGCEPRDLLSVDPLKPDAPKLIYDKLRAASPQMQQRALQVLEALLLAS